MARFYQESLLAVCCRVMVFWWVVFTFIALGHQPGLLLDAGHFLAAMYGRIWYLALGSIVAVCGVGFYVFFLKEKALIDLSPSSELGIKTTIGPVPKPVAPVKRVGKLSQRLPILERSVAVWLLEQNVPVDEIVPTHSIVKSRDFTQAQVEINSAFRDELDGIARADKKWSLLATNAVGLAERLPVSVYGKLFLAVWDTYAAHKHYPASHREGGHGSVRLHQHCLSVAGRCLETISPLVGGWKFDGIYVKRRGRNPVRMFENSTGYQPNVNDPLIPIIGLAHDLGKIEAYVVDKKGRIQKNLEPLGNTQADDDRGVIHDVLGPRILSRMPEFWELPPSDRAVINTAIAHYHHPSKFPINRHGMIFDYRAAALMMLMITADRSVSADEAGIDPKKQQSNELTEDEVLALYECFVQIVCTPGRINGLGNPVDDAAIRIGQKHADFIVIKMSALMALLRKELGISLESGEHKHDFTNQLLSILKEKGLLYTFHKNVDFSLYSPMYRVGLYHHATSKHFGDLAPALLLNIPAPEMEEFYSLTHLALNPANVIVKGLILSHLNKDKIKDKSHLSGLISQAFGAEEAEGDAHVEVEDDPDGPLLRKTEVDRLSVPVEQVSQENKSVEGGIEGAAQNLVAGGHHPADGVLKVIQGIDQAALASARTSVKGRKQRQSSAAKPSVSVIDLVNDDEDIGVESAVPELDLETPPSVGGSSSQPLKVNSRKRTEVVENDKPVAIIGETAEGDNKREVSSGASHENNPPSDMQAGISIKALPLDDAPPSLIDDDDPFLGDELSEQNTSSSCMGADTTAAPSPERPRAKKVEIRKSLVTRRGSERF